MSDPSDKPEDKKILVDEDWKSQVEAEKEKVSREPTSGPKPSGAKKPRMPMPKPTLEFLATSLAMQASVALGQIPNPATGKLESDLDYAKHLIDTVELLYEKTAGNRTPDETAAFDELLHQLRIAYVMTIQHPQQPTA